MNHTAAKPGEVSHLFRQLAQGEGRVVDQLFSLFYDELRVIAHGRICNEPSGDRLSPRALVHEAYLKLVDQDRVEWQNRAHFFAVAARAMRRVLLDYAIARKAQKRRGDRRQVPLDEVALEERCSEEILSLDEALQRLESRKERHGRVVECRFFGGMSIEETAVALAISPATVKRDWALARAWLHRELAE